MRLSARRLFESLEARTLFHLELISEIPNTAVAPGTSVSEINLAPHFDDETINGTVVRMQTDVGDIDVEMFDQGAPVTVTNFLGYVNRGDYDNTVFHRALSGFIVQGGGYLNTTQPLPHVTQQPRIQNEFSPSRSNLRGTIAMAKIGPPEDQDPTPETINSATSEFFFNLENNASNLDNQNGGFTVFGRVLGNSMAVVDSIAGLPRGSVQALVPNQPDPPVLAPIANVPFFNGALVGLDIARVIPEAGIYTYTVSSTNPGLVTPVVENGVLKLNYGAGQIGTADITVVATAVDGTTVSDTFTAGVAALDVAIGDGGAKAATFTDADGTTATVSLKGGSGLMRFLGSNLSQSVGRTGALIQGVIDEVTIDLTGTGGSGALSVRAKGSDGLVTINRLTSDGGMKSIAAKQVSVVGDVTIAGNVGKADFADVSNSVMTFNGSGGSMALSLRNADAVEIVSQNQIKTLKANTFTGGSPDAGTITAPGIGSLTVAGDFNQRLELAGGLGSAKIGGAVNSFLPWNVAGGAGKVSFGSTVEGFVADFLGPVASLAVTAGNLAGDISAPSIKSLSVKGDMSGANLTLTGGGVVLGRATVTGSIANSRIQAAEAIGSVTAAAINASTIYAGLNTDGGILPLALDEFSPAASSIAAVSIRSRSGAPAFVNANIAARSLGRISLGIVQAGNAGVPFGLAADAIASLSATGTQPIKLSRAETADKTVVQDDFEVRVL